MSSSPRSKRKRLRSLTPSESGLNGGDAEALRSPLAKRKKLAADRSGASKLKEGITAEQLHTGANGSARTSPTPAPARPGDRDSDEDEEDEDGDEEMDEDDDFLARELGEEWG